MTKPDVDLAGHAYWEDVWERTGQHSVGQFSYFHHALARLFRRHVTRGAQICEVGCADSAWIPYFIDQGMRVSGIDYSEKGVARLQRALERRGLSANLIAADMLDPAARPTAANDLVFSLGLVEHFRDPGAILRPMRDLLRDGGVLVTVVPNLLGLWGFLEGRVAPEVLAVHVLYSPPDLDAIHRQAGFEALEPARHFGTFGPLMMNVPSIERRYPRTYRFGTGCLWLLEQAVAWPLGTTLGRRSETRLLSSHIVGVYRRTPREP